MAQKRTIDAAIDDLFKYYEKVLKKAVKYATYKAKQDIYNHAYSCLEAYYDSRIPNSYERTNTLIHSFVPYSDINQKGNNIISVAGIEYNPDRLGAYEGTGSKNYIPDNQWIIDNYLAGIHPTTNGARNSEDCEYIPITRLPSPQEKMEKYINAYADIFDANLLISFARQIK
jgi:hypothetical protein